MYKAGVAEHVAAVDDAACGDIQTAADGLDEAVLAVDIGVLQDAVTVVAGDQLGDVFQQQSSHIVCSFIRKMGRKKEQAASGLLFLYWGQRSSRK